MGFAQTPIFHEILQFQQNKQFFGYYIEEKVML